MRLFPPNEFCRKIAAVVGLVGCFDMSLFRVFVVLLSVSLGLPAVASPFIEPGDSAARRDVELLAAHRIIQGPAISWPLPWHQVAPALDHPDIDRYPHLRAAAARLRKKYIDAVVIPNERPRGLIELEGSTSPQLVRGFESPPRDYAEARVGVEASTGNFSWRAMAGVDREVGGDTDFNLDGSFVAYEYGNVLFHAGLTEHWWGPGRDGALQLSNNSRPFPMLSVTRVRPLPFENRWLSWIGPWRLTGFVGMLTDDDRAVDRPFVAGMRVEAEPIPGLQIGATRTAQFCGSGLPCGAEVLFDTLIGADNNNALGANAGSGTSDQKAGVDVKYATAIGAYDVEVYGEVAGEDQAGFLPSKEAWVLGAGFGGPFGVEGDRFRVHGEYADTATSDPNIFYSSGLYPSGNTFDGEVIGHSIEQDSRLYTLGGAFDATEGWSVWGRVGVADLNRDGRTKASQPGSFPDADRLGVFDAGTRIELMEGRAEVGAAVSYVTDNINSGRRARDQLGGTLQLNLKF